MDVGFFEEIDHPSEGRILKTKTPNSFTGGMRRDTLPAPHIGEQTRDVLAELGYDAAAVEAMLASGAAIEPA